MNATWLDELERGLEERLTAFLRENPYQELLLREQHQKDHHFNLLSQRQKLQKEAKQQRQQLLELATNVREWSARSKRAKKAGALVLADRADQHVAELMEQGRQLWSDLDQLGNRFKDVEQRLCALSQKSNRDHSTLEEDWTSFEAQQELEELKRKHSPRA
ncbi:MAG: hercynine metabolism protein [Prochlorococcus sp.]